MTRRLFVLVPSLAPTGPIKGAVALCNSLADRLDVTLVALKPSPAFPGPVDSRIRQVSLGDISGWRARLRAYRTMLEAAGGRAAVISFSCCLSADVCNYFMRRQALTLTSIRGHLPRTYRVDYGPAGTLLAMFHYFVARQLDGVIAMTHRMAQQFASITGRHPAVIGNFIEESLLEPLRSPSRVESGAWRFVFVGRLDPLKSPGLVIEALGLLAAQGIRCTLDLYGDGPLMARLRAMVMDRGLGGIVTLHGHVDNPWAQAATAHCLVLPSLTEGVSRAALEALYLGIPCVMRDVDSNAELIRPGLNGELFREDAALAAAMKSAAELGRRLEADRPVLLDEQFRQAACIDGYRQLLQAL